MPDLPHDGRVTLSGTTAAARPELAGTVIEDNVHGFVFTRTDSAGTMTVVGDGKIQLRVVKTNAGTLDFNYRIRELRLAPGASVRAVSIFGFAEFRCDVDYRTDGMGEVGPEAANRYGGFIPPVTFEFRGLTRPSYFFFIKTDQTRYDRDNPLFIQAQDASGTVTTRVNAGFAPATT
jgi:hypothetical protein